MREVRECESAKNDGRAWAGWVGVTRGACSLLIALLSLAAGCVPASSPAPATGYRVVPPLPAGARARADSTVRVIEQMSGDAWETHTFRGSDGTQIAYRLLPPENPRPGMRYPLVVVLHGSGEIGNDNQRQLDRFPKSWARPEIRREWPAYVLAPQMPERSANYFPTATAPDRTSEPGRPLAATLELIDRLRADLPVDSSRVYAMGFSMGASTVYLSLSQRPGLFAAAIPIAGVPTPSRDAATLARTPLWIIHGNSDDVTPSALDLAGYSAIAGVPGARATFWEYDSGEHAVPVDLLASDAFPRWLWAHRLTRR